MKRRPTPAPAIPALAYLVSATLMLVLAGCDHDDPKTISPGGAAGEPAATAASADGEVPAEDRQLLELAFRAASAPPANSYPEERSRLQEEVVLQALATGLAGRAAVWCAQIEGWRRGTACAALALRCAKKSDHPGALRWLAEAGGVADRTADGLREKIPGRDRIRAAIARVHLLLGDREAALKAAAGLGRDMAAEMMETRAETMTREQVLAFLATLPPLLERGDLVEVRAALAACADLHNRFYYDVDLRRQLASIVTTAHAALPLAARIELLGELAEAAVNHVSGEAGIEPLDQAAQALAAGSFSPEQVIPIQMRLAALRWRCGDRVRSREAVATACAAFPAQRDRIADSGRARVLSSIAEALQVMGDTAASTAMFARVVAAGVENQTSLPRAGVLVATCLAMVRSGVAPDAALAQQLSSLVDALGPPW